MKTAKEKARELVDRLGKEHALILVDRMDIAYQEETPKENPYLFLSQLEYYENNFTNCKRMRIDFLHRASNCNAREDYNRARRNENKSHRNPSRPYPTGFA